MDRNEDRMSFTVSYTGMTTGRVGHG